MWRSFQILLFTLFIYSLNAQIPSGFEALELEDALKRSELQNKPVLYFLYASWCPHCHVMRDQVLADARVKAQTDRFVAVALDGETTPGKKIMQRYRPQVFPAFLVLDAKGELLYGFTGEVKAPDFINELSNALNPQRQLPYLRRQFLADTQNADKCYQLILALRKARQDASAVAHQYFKNIPDSQMVSAQNWRILANAIHDINAREIQFVINHQKDFEAVSSPARVGRKLANLVQELLRPAIEAQDSIRYLKDRETARKVVHRAADSIAFTLDLRMWEQTKSWERYRLALRENARNYLWDDAEKLKDAAQTLFKNAQTQSARLMAADLAKRSLEIKPAIDGYLLVARLQDALGNRELAVEAAGKAKEMSQKLGFPSPEADEIINQSP